MKKIKRKDQVIILTGRDKGRQGEVTRLDGDRVYVSGVNMIKRHVKPNPMLSKPGGIVEAEASIHISNLAIYNSETQKADRVGFRDEEGKKIRIFKSTNKVIQT